MSFDFIAELALWIPLHAVAATQSCYHAFRVPDKWSRATAYALLIGASALFLKSLSEYNSLTSFDMQKQEVQEKIGSLLVLLATGLQLEALDTFLHSTSKQCKIEKD